MTLAAVVALLGVAELLAAAGLTADPLAALGTADGVGPLAMALLGVFVLLAARAYAERTRPAFWRLVAAGAAAELVRLGLQLAAGWPAAAWLRSTGLGAGVAALAIEGLALARRGTTDGDG